MGGRRCIYRERYFVFGFLWMVHATRAAHCLAFRASGADPQFMCVLFFGPIFQNGCQFG